MKISEGEARRATRAVLDRPNPLGPTDVASIYVSKTTKGEGGLYWGKCTCSGQVDYFCGDSRDEVLRKAEHFARFVLQVQIAA